MNDQKNITDTPLADAIVTCETSQQVEVHGRLLRLGRHELAFEVHGTAVVLQTSEVLTDFKVISRDQPIFTGQAVVTGLVQGAENLVCQVSLDGVWSEFELAGLVQQPEKLEGNFAALIKSWSKFYRILPEFKIAVADIQSFLFDLRHWTEQIEVGMAALPSAGQTARARENVRDLVNTVSPGLNNLFWKFELAASKIPEDQRAEHAVYARRQLHPLLLSSPFLHRVYRKPLGYPGDYEMVNMIMRDPAEGASVFSRLINQWILNQTPAVGHRNRIQVLKRRLEEEAARVWQREQPLRVFNLGCGPAREVEELIRESDLSNRMEFTLVDFNEETLQHTGTVLGEARRLHGRRTGLRFVKRSVAQMLKSRSQEIGREYDLVYCAGLFDYLPDRVCRRLLEVFYELAAPGGLVLATNVDTSNPIIGFMHYVVEWDLIYRNSSQFAALAPAAAPPEDSHISAENSGSNIFLHIRKPRAPS
jgi:extracellular factor (EF) 3-hydroxypalmitic acid methyl ester biosynthesis protein